MKKQTKRFLAMLLSLTMLLNLGMVTTFATEEEGTWVPVLQEDFNDLSDWSTTGHSKLGNVIDNTYMVIQDSAYVATGVLGDVLKNVDTTAQYTVEFRAKVNNWTYGPGTAPKDCNSLAVQLFPNANGRFTFTIEEAGVKTSTTSGTWANQIEYPEGFDGTAWHTWKLVCNTDGTVDIYVDEVELGSGAIQSRGVTQSGVKIYAKGHADSGKQASAYVDFFKLYDADGEVVVSDDFATIDTTIWTNPDVGQLLASVNEDQKSYLHLYQETTASKAQAQITQSGLDLGKYNKFKVEFDAKVNQASSGPGSPDCNTIGIKLVFNGKRLMFTIEDDFLKYTTSGTWSGLTTLEEGTVYDWVHYTLIADSEAGAIEIFMGDEKVADATMVSFGTGSLVEIWCTSYGTSPNTDSYMDNFSISYFSENGVPLWGSDAVLTIENTVNGFTATWPDATDATAYSVVVGDNEPVIVTEPTYTVTGLTNADGYVSIKVTAVNDLGNSAISLSGQGKALWNPGSDSMDIYQIVAGKNNGGDTQYNNYRIPGIIVTSENTVICYWEARLNGSDWDDMNIVAIRSEDGGETWSEEIIVVDGVTTQKTVNNPVMVEDNEGTLHMLYCVEYGTCSVCKGAVGDADGPAANCEHGNGVFHITSKDDGKTWSEPVNIAAETFSDEIQHNVIATGPGHAICTSDGTLIASVWLVQQADNQALTYHHPGNVATLYSEDNGETWQIGELVPNDAEGENDVAVADPNETMLAETSDGRIMLNIRSGGGGYRALAWSETGYSDWTEMEYDYNLIDPTCMGSLLAYNIEGDPYTMLLVNCESTNSRTNLVVKGSVDNGKTWTIRKVIDPGAAGYSDIAVDSKGIIYVLYEVNGGTTCNLARLNYECFTADSNLSEIPVTGISVDKSEANLMTGEQLVLTAAVEPEDATNTNVTWTSSNEDVATVNISGVVTAVKAGTATITVTTEDGEFTARCELTVLDKSVVEAEAAAAAAQAAQVAAETAQSAAEQAESNAVTAKEAAEAAQSKAEAAQSAAETAQSKAEAAQTAAEAAAVAAGSDSEEAAAAKAAAVEAQSKAEAAQAAAETAKSEANNAKTAAEAAKINAETAQSKAEAAKTAAENAATAAEQSNAQAAQEAAKAAEEAAKATTSASTAAAESAKAAQSASDAATSAEEAANAAADAASSANEAAQSARNAAESADAAKLAEEAAEAAQKAAEEAQTKAEQAKADAVTAQKAAETAQTKAEAAQTAAESAQKEAEEAQKAAEEAAASAGADSEEAKAAQTAAVEAKTKAEAAQAAAETAMTEAMNAKTAAETAETNAETAQTKAEAAQTAAEDAAKAAAESNVEAAQEAAKAAEEAGKAATSASAAAAESAKAAQSASEAATSATNAANAAADAASSANEAAQSAKKAAESADAAKLAEEAAEAAQKAAEEAQTKAEQAEADAVIAQQAAEQAKTDAENAKTAAEEAKAKAEEAKDAALEAEKNAGEDAQAAENAKAAAEAAQALAETAQAKAAQAEIDAQTAQKNAESAQANAETAKAAAETAQDKAEAAAEAAEENNVAAAQEAAKAAEEAAKAATESGKATSEAAKAAQSAGEAVASASASAKSAEESAGYAADAALSAKDAQVAKKAAEDAQAAAEAAQKEAEKAAEEAAKKEAAAIEAAAKAEAEKKAAEEAAEKAEKEATEKAVAAELAVVKYQAMSNLNDAAEVLTMQTDELQTVVVLDTLKEYRDLIADAADSDEVAAYEEEAMAAMEAASVCPSEDYSDVNQDAWYHEAVDYVISRGMMNGTGENVFDPNGTMTRAQLVTVLYRIAGSPSVESLENVFTDVAEGSWYEDAVIWAADAEVVKGVTDTTFDPGSAITREQMVVMLYRFAQANVYSVSASSKVALAEFDDADQISAYAEDAMLWAVENQIVNGIGNGIDPKGTATRAQLATIMMRWLEK